MGMETAGEDEERKRRKALLEGAMKGVAPTISEAPSSLGNEAPDDNADPTADAAAAARRREELRQRILRGSSISNESLPSAEQTQRDGESSNVLPDGKVRRMRKE